MKTELRQSLQVIPTLELTVQNAKLEDIRKIKDHSINPISSEHLFHKWGTYNCFEFALGLTIFPDYITVKKQNVFANSEFISYLLSKNLFEKGANEGIIIYFDNDTPKHAGQYSLNRVQSKWGSGLVFDHEILETPLSYGNMFKIYKNIDSETVLDYFYDYAASKGIAFSNGS